MPCRSVVGDNLTHIGLIGAVAPARHSRAEPNSSCQAWFGWFSQTHPMPKQIGQFLSIRDYQVSATARTYPRFAIPVRPDDRTPGLFLQARPLAARVRRHVGRCPFELVVPFAFTLETNPPGAGKQPDGPGVELPGGKKLRRINHLGACLFLSPEPDVSRYRPDDRSLLRSSEPVSAGFTRARALCINSSARASRDRV